MGRRFGSRRVRGSEDNHTYYYTYNHTYYYTYICSTIHTKYKSTIQNIQHKSTIHIYLCTPLQIYHFFSSMHKPYPTYTYTFVVLYTYLQVVPGCFFLFRFSLNKDYPYPMTYSFPISLHKFPYFLANLLIFNYLCINDFSLFL